MWKDNKNVEKQSLQQHKRHQLYAYKYAYKFAQISFLSAIQAIIINKAMVKTDLFIKTITLDIS